MLKTKLRKVTREPTYKDWDDRRGLNWIDGKAYGLAEDGRTIQVEGKKDGYAGPSKAR